MKILAHIWTTQADTPDAMYDVPTLADAARYMSDFMINGWWRMDFYTDGVWTHRVQASAAEQFDPTILEILRGANKFE